MAKSKIHIKPENKGKFNATKKKTGKTTEELTHSKNPVTKKRAVFAQNAAKWKHADGGYIDSMNYAYGSYFDDRNKNMQTSQTVANTVGQAIPIAGVFKGIGEGAANIIAPKDEYGVSDSSGFAQGVAGFLNPLESTTSVYDDIKKGEFDSKTAMQLLLPGVGSVMQNKENKTARNNMLLQEKMKDVNASRLGQYNNENPQALPTYALGGDVNELNQRNDLGYKYYAWGGTPSWSPNERPMHNSIYAAGGDINKLSDLKGYGYNLMPNGGYVESPAWYRSNALTMEAGGHLPEGNSTLKEAKEFLKLYPEEMEMGTEVEYEHTGNTKLAQRIAADHIKDSLKMNQGNPPDYYKRLQEAGISDELNKMPQLQMAKGGFLKPEKAKEMLKDGRIHGKPITDRQRKYFNAIANGWTPNKMGGGPMDSLQTYAEGGSFGNAFSEARKQGLKEFEWSGKKYSTQTADEAIAQDKKQWIYTDRPGYAYNTKPTFTNVTESSRRPIEEYFPEEVLPQQPVRVTGSKYIQEPSPQQLPYPSEKQTGQPARQTPRGYIPEQLPQQLPYPKDRTVFEPDMDKNIIPESERTKILQQSDDQSAYLNPPKVVAPQRKTGSKYISEPEPQQLPYPVDRVSGRLTNSVYQPGPLPQELPYPKDKPIAPKKEVVYNNPKSETTIAKQESKYIPPVISNKEIIEQERSMPSDVRDRLEINRKNKSFETFNGKYYVFSKENSQIYLFNNKHELVDSTIAGRGKSIGDKINRADVDTPTPGPHAYTRAGSAVLTEAKGRLEKARDIDDFGAPAYRIKYNDIWGASENMALHAIYKNEKEFRESVLKDPSKIDKLISWGCINVNNDWITDPRTKPSGGDSLYITKEPLRNLKLAQKQFGGPIQSFPDGGFIGAGIGMNELKKDPIVKNMEKTSNRYNEVMSKYGKLSYGVTGDMIQVKDKSSFVIKDIENGKPGIRNTGKINKEVLAAISKAAAKKKVPLMTALETGMRETGLGSHDDSISKFGVYHPSDIMQNTTEVGLPDSFDQYLLKNNLVDKKDVKRNNNGLLVTNPYKYNQHIDSYDKYLSSYKNPYAGASPFEREMDVLSKQSGQAYNPGEANRVEKLKRERQVIMNNPQLYNYADSVYNSNMALGGIVNKLPSTGGIQDKTSSGSMKDDINNNDRVFTEYKGGGTHEQSSLGGIPIGQKAKVEDGEVRVNFDDGDYIFSNRY